MNATALLHLPHHVQHQSTAPLVFCSAYIKDRAPLLANPFAHETLRLLWEQAAECNGWWVGDYVLMPDHVHFFARPNRDADGLNLWMKTWKAISSKTIAQRHGRPGPVWEPNAQSRFVRINETYAAAWMHMDANPVRTGLVEAEDEWPYRGRIHRLVNA